MAYLRPVQAVGRPDSIAAAPTSTNVINRGQALYLDPTTGQAYGDVSGLAGGATGRVFLGFADDNKTTSLVGAIKDQVINLTGTVAAGAVTFSPASVNVGKTVTSSSVTEINAALGGGALPASWSMAVVSAVGGTIGGGVTYGGTIAADGTLTLTMTGTTLTNGACTLALTLSYDYLVVTAGATTVSDMFSNDSTLASGLVTYWFMPGIYETDQYDPLAVYTAGAPIGILEDGRFCLASNANAVAYGGSPYVIGVCLVAPSANYNGFTKTVNGHQTPAPEALRILFNPAFVALD